MRAIVQDRYGAPSEVLRLAEVPTPEVGAGDVLVRVAAASIHIGDYFMMLGVPYVLRPAYGIRRPRHRTPGSDIAGTVEAVGRDVTGLAPGDEVFGWCTGAFSELVVAPAGQFLRTPAGMSHEEASSMVTSAITALQAMRTHGKVRPGQHVLVNGAAGGVGTFAVQVAKALGAEVTGVCSTRNVELVRSIGADHVIDYTREDFTQGGPRYDLILDNVGNHGMSRTRRALTPDGMLLSNGAPVGGWFGGLTSPIKAFLASIVVRQQGRPFVSMPSREDLAGLVQLAEDGKLRAVIDRTLPLEQAAEAMTYVGRRHAQGKVVLSV